MSDARRMFWSQAASVLLHALAIACGGMLLLESARFGVQVGQGGRPASARPQELMAEIEIEPPEQAAAATPPPLPIVQEKVPDVEPPKPVPVPARVPPAAATSEIAAPRAVAARLVRHAAPGTDAGQSAGDGAQVAARPDYLSNPPPEYPDAARRARQQGVVVLAVRVTAGGAVEALTLQKSSNFFLLDRAASEAVRSWRFHPARLGGVPVSSTVLVPVRFKLEGGL